MRGDAGAHRRCRLALRGSSRVRDRKHGLPPSRRERPRLGVQPGPRGHHPRGRLRARRDVLPVLRRVARAVSRRSSRRTDLGREQPEREKARHAQLLLFTLQQRMGVGLLASCVRPVRCRDAPLAGAPRFQLARARTRRPKARALLDAGVPGDLRRPRRHLGLPVGLFHVAARNGVGSAQPEYRAEYRIRIRCKPHSRSRSVRE